MPGIINSGMYNRLRANPDNFSPLDINVWEWIVDDVAPDEDTMSVEQGVATMSGYLYDHDALWDAVAYFVGYSQVAGSTTVLHRSLPAVHPRWPYFRCTTVSVRGVEYAGTTVPDGVYAGSKYMTLPRYRQYRFDVTFEQPQFDYKADGAVSSEWDRMLTVDTQDEGETIVVDGGLMYYTTSSLFANPATIAGPSLKVYAERSGIVVTAYGIPAEWVMDQYGMPTNFLAAKGRVNGTTFLGQAGGTMLLQGWRFTKRAQPIATNSLNALTFSVNVEMHFSHTDPTRFDPGEVLRGWQLVPRGGNATGWHGVRDNNGLGSPLYNTYDMHRLLQLVGS